MLRYPDIPCGEISRAHLSDMPEWFATLKIDGWRCMVHRRQGSFTYWSKVLLPLEVCDEVRRPFEAATDAAFGDDFILDCELTGNRRAGDAHDIIALEMLEYNDLFHESRSITALTPAYQRWLIVDQMLNNFAVPATLADFAGFYDRHMGIALAEGVVLKKIDGRYIGRAHAPAKNSGILKCKWRAGLSGTTIKE